MPTLTPEETCDEQVMRTRYALADGKTKEVADFLDGRTQVVVWPPSLASDTLVYPYAKAKGPRHA